MDEQKKIEKNHADEAIVAHMKSYRDEFVNFYKTYYNRKGVAIPEESNYDIGPFELFVFQKLAKLSIATDLKQAKIENRVKELLNEFIEKVNNYALGVTEDGGRTDGERTGTGN